MGKNVRVIIRPRDVAISLKRPDKMSFQNIFQATVEDVADINGALVDVLLNIGCPIISRITAAAKTDLMLSAGQQVFILIKSVAISQG